MDFTKAELSRIYELTQWAVEKKSTKDRDCISAYSKMKSLIELNADFYRINEVGKTPYGALSDNAKAYIKRREQEGKKNTYHSIMAVLDYRRKHESSLDKEDIRNKYISKYKIDNTDIAVFNEIFDTCFDVFSGRKYYD